MLKGASNTLTDTVNEKRGSTKKAYQGPLASGLNRRAFLRTSTAISLLAGLTLTKPSFSVQKSNPSNASSLDDSPVGDDFFTAQQHEILDAVQMQLFPDDGDGPSARDLNVIIYLEWAMTDPQNIADDDPDYIAQGIGWLNDLSKQTHGDNFVKLSHSQQGKLLIHVAKSQAGENWISLLLYYLTEALMLDPIYGGNPKMIGWQWLQHQAGFPAPITGKTYRDFE